MSSLEDSKEITNNGRVGWAGRQWSRFDLTVTKLQKFVSLIGSASMLATAIALGAEFVVLILLIIGVSALMLVSVVLDKVGFQRSTFEETFDQQTKMLWWNQVNVLALLYNIYGKSDSETQEKMLRKYLKRLRIAESELP